MLLVIYETIKFACLNLSLKIALMHSVNLFHDCWIFPEYHYNWFGIKQLII